jgi:hypothetical protein
LKKSDIRKSDLFLSLVAACCLVLLFFSAHALVRIRNDAAAIGRTRALVEDLELTDLCLFTEARYTRNLSQADLQTPFQDHPMSLEHFPSGSLAMPPQGERRYGKKP